MTLARLRDNALLWSFAFYLILNAGFMQVRIPPGGASGVPIAELVLIGALLAIPHARVLPKFGATLFILPFALWWALGLGRAVAGFFDHGFWALRDAIHVLESLFLYVGFAMALKPEAAERFFRWLKILLIVAAVYTLGLPFAETLQSLSPSLTAAAGYERALLFQYQSFYCVSLWAVAYLLIFRQRGSGVLPFAFAAVLLAFTVIFYPARTLYLQVMELVLLLVIFKRGAFSKAAIIVLVGMVLLAFLPTLELKIETRFGEAISLDFLVRHFMTSFGQEAKGVEAAAYGTDLRLFWWADLLRRVSESLPKMLFGLGYGFPLVELQGAAVDIREPHNSYVSLFSRIGFVGLGLFLWMHVLLFRKWAQAYALAKRLDWRIGRDRLLLMLAFFSFILLLGMTEDAFEKPFLTFPYYFSWGVVLALAHNLRAGVYVPRAGASARSHETRPGPGAPARLRPPHEHLHRR